MSAAFELVLDRACEGASRAGRRLARVGAGHGRALEHTPLARDVLAGLGARRKSIPCTWLYDKRGSELFERITALPEYYATRIEIAILERCAEAIAEAAGPHATLIELGSGSSRKTPILLGALQRPAAYVPVDISAEFLALSVRQLAARFPHLPIEPLVADFTDSTHLRSLPLPEARGRRVVFFPGSTIGNFTPDAATDLLHRIGRAVGPDSLLVIGADHTRDASVLLPAYNDASGVTAAFNKNLLARINRELEGTFDLGAFRHVACYQSGEQRVEMHLVSEYTQHVQVLGRTFSFAMGDSIHTENSYKYSLVRFLALAHRAGWTQEHLWMDGAARFAVHVLRLAP